MQSTSGRTRRKLFLAAGILLVGIGLTASSFGSVWSPQVYEFLFNFTIVESVDVFMPYFPLVPFYPIFVMMLGAFLIVKSRS